MPLQPKPFLSLEGWLEGERAALESRSEYLDGEVFAMTCMYPDLVAHCGEPELLDDRRDVLLNPGLIVEILSDSTKAYDREGKGSA